MIDLEWMIPRPVLWLMNRGWDWLAAKLVPVDDALADVGDAYAEEDIAA